MAVPVNTSVPTISAHRIVGQVILGGAGLWTGSPTLTYQWERAQVVYDDGQPVYDDGELVIEPWEEISGATALSYFLLGADQQYILRLREKAVNVDAPSGVFAYSAESEIILGAIGDGGLGDSYYDTFAGGSFGFSFDNED